MDMIDEIKKQDTLFIKKVLAFYEKKGRHDLIWRKHINPYRILVSEIMLQQTQVGRVIQKFETWMKLYPTLSALRKAKFGEVLMLWQGLGYQRRAKALYDIAGKYTEIPEKFSELLDMPCVGTYTASAISAFAYNQFSHPMLETNIRTALIEEFHIGEEEIHDGLLYDDISRLVSYKKVQTTGARYWYYALMDYGAHLKENKISHNTKSLHYTKQTVYKGSFRELRAKVLFAITHKEKLPDDERLAEALVVLQHENYIHLVSGKYKLKE